MIKKFIVRIYWAVTDYFLHKLNSKLKWGDKKGD